MSVHSDNEVMDNPPSEKRKEGAKNNDMMAMMLEMQKSISSLASTVSDIKQNQGKKRKNSDTEKAGHSKTDLSDISDDERGAFDEIVDETRDDDDDNNDEMDCDTILDDLADCFGSDDKCIEAIHEKLAKVANEGVRTAIDPDKIKEVSEKYHRPKNVQNLVTPKLNEEIRAQLSRKVKTQDIRWLVGCF